MSQCVKEALKLILIRGQERLHAQRWFDRDKSPPPPRRLSAAPPCHAKVLMLPLSDPANLLERVCQSFSLIEALANHIVTRCATRESALQKVSTSNLGGRSIGLASGAEGHV